MGPLSVFKPSKWKLVFSLVPFVLFLNQLYVFMDLMHSFFPIEVDLVLEYPIYFFAFVEILISKPLAPILDYFGWWSRNSLFVGPDGPLLPGSFAVAVVYAVLMYTLFSLASLWKNNRRLK